MNSRHAAEERRRQQDALLTLTNLQRHGGDPTSSLQTIASTAAATLDVARVSVWRYCQDRTGIRCLSLFESQDGRHSSGQEISGATHPAYFRALQESKVIAAHDARDDPRTAEFDESHLRPLGITAMLDAPLRVDGELEGVLCHEHVGSRRQWTTDEEAFAVGVANIVSLVLEGWDRRQAEEALAESEALLQFASRVGRLGAWSVDVRSLECRWSDEARRILELDAEVTPASVGLLALCAPEDRERLAEAFRVCRRDGTPFDEQLRVITASQRDLSVRSIGTAVRSEDGTIIRVQGAIQDVTDQMAAVEERRGLAERLYSTLESITDGLLTIDRNWCFTFVNKEAERMLEQPRARLLGRCAWDVLAPAVGTAFEREARRAIEEQVTVALEEYYPALGKWFGVKAYASPDGLAVYLRDVTERHHDRDMLREQGAMLDHATDAIAVRDLDHSLLYWNRSAQRLYGWTTEEVRGRSALDLQGADTAPFRAAFDATLAKGEWIGELNQVSKDGRELIVESRWTLIRNDRGQPTSILAINTDATDRRRLERQCLRAQRLESIGTLAGGIAHDLNNVLTPIMMSIALLKEDERDADRLEVFATMEKSARRGAEMVRQVLSFAGGGVEGQRIDVDVRRLVCDVLHIARDTFPKDIVIEKHFGAGLWTLQADPTQLHQVLLNLCLNARDAMPDGGRLTIRAGNIDVDEHYAAMNGEVALGPHVAVDVEDDGCGILPKHIDRIFEPFFTTKEVGKGTGLGLATSLAIVRSHGGTLRAYSVPGAGSRFRLYLPARTSRPSAQIVDAPSRPRGHGETVLVVDDEASIRQIARRTLETSGYRVLTACDGVEAVSVYGQHGTELAVVLIDMMMPVMDGPATIQNLLRLNPQVRIVAASGLPASGDRARSMGVRHFLAKPYSAEGLLSAIRLALQETMPAAG